MNQSGQLQFEAIIVFLIFAIIIGIFANLAQNIFFNSHFFENENFETESFACAISADSIYSNSFGIFYSEDLNCDSSKNIMLSGNKSAQSIAKNLEKSIFSGKISINVMQNEHYR